MHNKNFCALPFHHTKIEPDGFYSVCCSHRVPEPHRRNIRDTTAEQWYHSSYLSEVRESFLRDERHPGCSLCWQNEDQNQRSMRIRTQREYEILGVDVHRPAIKNIEIQASNLCNLSCLMCNERNSSVIQAENRRLGISVMGEHDLRWTEQHFRNLQDLLAQEFQVLNVLGGEPFYNKRLLSVLQAIPEPVARRATLQIITNGTVYNQQWQSVMERFGLVRIMFSVDAVDDLYGYMRYPGVWLEVDRNIKAIKELTRTKCMVNCTVQNLNILYLDGVIDWCLDNDLWLELAVLQHPAYLAMTNLPLDLRRLAHERLEQWCNRYRQPNIQGPLQDFRALFQANLQDPGTELWHEFQQQIAQRDLIRGNSWQKFLTPTAS